jgi:hypothetical protein
MMRRRTSDRLGTEIVSLALFGRRDLFFLAYASRPAPAVRAHAPGFSIGADAFALGGFAILGMESVPPSLS